MELSMYAKINLINQYKNRIDVLEKRLRDPSLSYAEIQVIQDEMDDIRPRLNELTK